VPPDARSAWRDLRRDTVLAAIVAGFVTLSVLYQVATPPLEAPDEAGHFAAVLYLKDHRRLPVAGRLSDALIVDQELLQPPLYYVLGALVTAPIDTSNARDFVTRRPHAPMGRADIPGPKHAWMAAGDRAFPYRGAMLAIVVLRTLSMLMGLATIALTYATARAIAPHDRDTARFAAALVAFNPMFVFMANAINNDNAAVPLVTLGVLLLLRLRGPGSPAGLGGYAGLGALAGAAALAKSSGLILTVVLAFDLLGRRWRRRRLAAGLVAGAAALAVYGWWPLRNRVLYGEWLGLATLTATAGAGRHGVRPWALLEEWTGFVKSYWGVFGAFNVVFPEPVYWLFYGLTAAGLAGIAWLLVRERGILPYGVPLLALVSVTNLLAVAYWTSRAWGSQGRFMFPSIAGTSVLCALALAAAGRRRSDLALAVSALLATLAAYGALVVIPAQYP
jgi:4-amino-4-deoxy-L-arabinose transferase-like glycosyltransferase